jgi:hypothetical protein
MYRQPPNGGGTPLATGVNRWNIGRAGSASPQRGRHSLAEERCSTGGVSPPSGASARGRGSETTGSRRWQAECHPFGVNGGEYRRRRSAPSWSCDVDQPASIAAAQCHRGPEHDARAAPEWGRHSSCHRCQPVDYGSRMIRKPPAGATLRSPSAAEGWRLIERRSQQVAFVECNSVATQQCNKLRKSTRRWCFSWPRM